MLEFLQTELLYMTDSYLKEFDATIKAISENGLKLYLDKTAFYPGGGGQPNDTGKIIVNSKEYEVTNVGRDKEKGIYHQLNQPVDAKVGDQLKGQISWERRYTVMKYHTALHILCGLIWKEFGAEVTGGKMYLDKARMDFNLEDFSQEQVQYIEKRVNEEIAADRKIRINILPREEAFKIPDLIRTKINLLPEHIKEVRTVEILGLDLQADGGTHLKSTKEVGNVRIVETINKGKENKRIVIQID
ncbi:MAG: alanyl-tRNA editing protein [Candidatus Heimdallarchaeota archaeon]|nr:alanyl-tRNA editing protein [Candidatus Heimdallarchaeota archaeon]